jgi:hypothetical protein
MIVTVKNVSTKPVLQVWLYFNVLTFYSLAVSLRATRFNIQKFYMVLAFG